MSQITKWARFLFQSVLNSNERRRNAARDVTAAVSPACQSEFLDARVMLSGNTMVELMGNTLRLTGDSNANNVSVNFDNDAGTVVVSENTGGTLNGLATPATFPLGSVSFIRADMNDGDDALTLTENPFTPNGLAMETLLVDMGQGANTFTATNIDFNQFATVSGGTGNDTMEMGGVEIGGDLRFRGLGGDDSMRLLNVKIGGTLRARTNSGNDFLQLNTVSTQGEMRIASGSGSLAFLGSALSSVGTATIRGNDSTDLIDIVGSFFGSNLVVSAFGGNDIVSASSITVMGQAQFVLGGGDDYLWMNGGESAAGFDGYLTFGNRLFVSGGDGDDTLNLFADQAFFNENLIYRGESGADIYFFNNLFPPLSFGTLTLQSAGSVRRRQHPDPAHDQFGRVQCDPRIRFLSHNLHRVTAVCSRSPERPGRTTSGWHESGAKQRPWPSEFEEACPTSRTCDGNASSNNQTSNHKQFLRSPLPTRHSQLLPTLATGWA